MDIFTVIMVVLMIVAAIINSKADERMRRVRRNSPVVKAVAWNLDFLGICIWIGIVFVLIMMLGN